MTPSVDLGPVAARPPVSEPAGAGPPPPADHPFAHYLTDEFTRDLTALVRRARALAAEAAEPGRHDRT